MPGSETAIRNRSDQQQTHATVRPPEVSLPKGGGAIRGIDETFRANPTTGSAGFTIPLPTSPGRSGMQPALALTYDSGSGNGPFGLGWQLDIPAVRRKTDRGVPRYHDGNDSDVFLLSGAEDLIPLRVETDSGWQDDVREDGGHIVRRYRPRSESTFARIERWTDEVTGEAYWRTLTRDNVIRLYGRTAQARVADPDAPSRVFEWLLEEERDELGNVTAYEYKFEDGAGVDAALPYERARVRSGSRCTYLYPKRIRYANAAPGSASECRLELVFDFGDHDEATPRPEEDRAWPVRPDAFSSFRSGFDVRCRRLCRRVLMFHRFPELGAAAALIRSLDLTYHESPVIAYLAAVTQSGYLPAGERYERSSLPSIEYEYLPAVLDPTVRVVEGFEDLPAGAHPGRHQWVDLDGEGMAGLLAVDGPAWYYKANEGNATLAPARLIGSRPSLSATFGARLFDLAGDGTLDLVQHAPGLTGYQQYERDAGWGRYQPFVSVPSVNWDDPNLRVVDLDGDGHADLLVTEDEVLRWHPSEGRRGFGAPIRITRTLDEEMGPTLMFASDTDSVFLASMSGDGLADIVRVRNGSVCYWPNRGHGHFGAKIVMANAPRFDAPDRFDPRRLRVADVDGSGNADLLYLDADRVRIALNRAGNGFDDMVDLPFAAGTDDVIDVGVADVLGDGTACLIWSSPLPQHASAPIRYVHLMAAGKPHLLVRTRNGRGLETTLSYAPSTRFYLEDKQAGTPWATRLPFPVHVLERVEVRDEVTGWKLATRYAYHHGHFDGEEREFRGFGAVDQWDTESFSDFSEAGVTNADIAHHRPPVRTRSWFHTGAWMEDERISSHFETEYYGGDPAAPRLPDTTLPMGLSTGEERAACRALRGHLLRQETYADDDTPESAHPYRVVERSYLVRLVQPAGEHDRGAFQVIPDEALTWDYERAPGDPRVSHSLTLAHDAYGHVTRAATIAYPRRSPSHDEQRATHVMVTESKVINQDGLDDAYHLGVPFETRAWELTGLAGEDANPFAPDALVQAFEDAAELSFDTPGDGAALEKRCISHERQLYRADDLTGPLPLGEIGMRALSFESFRLAVTDDLRASVFVGRVTDAMLEDAGYRRWDAVQHAYPAGTPAAQLAGEDAPGWWAPAGRSEFEDPAAAAAHFFLPDRIVDPFGAAASVDYDPHLLTATRVEDPLGNVSEAALDYRVLAPWRLTDPNGNRKAVAFDALGRVTAQAVMGKEGVAEGDTLADPTVRFEYEPFRWMNAGLPNRARTYSREIHGDPATRWVESVLYSDGAGNAVMTKARAEPGLAPARDADGALQRDANGALVWEHTNVRWVGSGRQILDNKGSPVKQYEPFFSDTDEYEAEAELAEWGVTPLLHYDPLGRLTRTDLPNETLRRIEFNPWRQTTRDENDTVLESGWYSARATGTLGPDEQRAAELAAGHADTPTIAYLDARGRAFLASADNGERGMYETRTAFDVQGKVLAVTDALGRMVMRYDHDLLGGVIHSASMDAGERWTLYDVAGKPVYTWNDRGHRLHTTYDAARRPADVFLQQADGSELVVARTIYGELEPNPEVTNLRGRVYQSFDSAGMMTNGVYDFKGNLLTSTRQLADDYVGTLDWTGTVSLEGDLYTTNTTYDALNRPITVATPDGSVLRPNYNEVTLLERVEGTLSGSGAAITFVADIDYNAKGQRELIRHGNDTTTTYDYDSLTFRLAHLRTERGADRLQDLWYTYDPVGSITHIRDDAQQAVFFRNQVVEPHAEYTYDAIYRLTSAAGREHIGQVAQPETTWNDAFRTALAHPHDGQAMRRYVEEFEYDAAGNILRLVHRATGGNWTRAYAYDEASPIEPEVVNNRLSSTVVGSTTEPYAYDAHGSMTAMPHMPVMQWDYLDRLTATARQAVTEGTPETTYYVYDAGGQRVRKVTERAAALGETPTRLKERVYLGGFEIYREYDATGATITHERETLHVVDGERRIALAETRTSGDDGSPAQLVRYQLGNHLGSAALELDDTAAVISYEEYYPYGSTSYQAVDAVIGAAAKRYRYTGKERDEETGLCYHGARYLACWLGRWMSCDPIGIGDGLNLYRYVNNNPIGHRDPSGMQTEAEELGVDPVGFIPLIGPGRDALHNLFAAYESGVEARTSLMEGEPKKAAQAFGSAVWNANVGSLNAMFAALDFVSLGGFSLLRSGVKHGALRLGGAVIARAEARNVPRAFANSTIKPLGDSFINPPHVDAPPGAGRTPAPPARPAESATSRNEAVQGGAPESPLPTSFTDAPTPGRSPSRRSRSLALGLDKSVGREGYYAWARRNRFQTWNQLSPAVPPTLRSWNLLDRIDYAMRQADAIFFNMEGFREPSRSMRAVTPEGRPVSSYTDYEYSSSIEIDELAAKTFFMDRDQDFIGPINTFGQK